MGHCQCATGSPSRRPGHVSTCSRQVLHAGMGNQPDQVTCVASRMPRAYRAMDFRRNADWHAGYRRARREDQATILELRLQLREALSHLTRLHQVLDTAERHLRASISQSEPCKAGGPATNQPDPLP